MRLNTIHKSIKVEGEGNIDVTTSQTTIKPEIGHIVEIGIHLIEAEEILTEILDQTIGVDQEIIIDRKDTDKVIGMTIPDKTTEGTTIGIIIGKIMDEAIIGNKGIEVQVGTVTEITIETIQYDQGRNTSKDRSTESSQGHGLEQNQKVKEIMIDQEQNQDLDQAQELVQIGTGLGVIGAESMITLQENVPTLL